MTSVLVPYGPSFLCIGCEDCSWIRLTDQFLAPIHDLITISNNAGIQFRILFLSFSHSLEAYDDLNKVITIKSNKEVLSSIDAFMYKNPTHLFHKNYRQLYTRYILSLGVTM